MATRPTPGKASSDTQPRVKRTVKPRAGEWSWPNLVRPTDQVLEAIVKEHGLNPASFLVIRRFVDALLPIAKAVLADVRKLGHRHRRVAVEQNLRTFRRFSDFVGKQVFPPTSAYPDGPLPLKWHRVFATSAALHLSRVASGESLVDVAKSRPPSVDAGFGRSSSDLRRWCHNVIEQNPGPAMAGILTALCEVLDETRRAMVSTGGRGGRPSYETGRWLLLNLAQLFSMLNRDPTGDRIGPFANFARDVVEAFGLPTGWIDSQLPTAIQEWRSSSSGNPPQK